MQQRTETCPPSLPAAQDEAPQRPPSGAGGGRQRGLDLVKGLAAYGVVVIHSLGGFPRSRASEQVVALFLGFAVPYFLAASLYLTAGKLLRDGTPGFLRGRVQRLIVPYLVWTAIFLAARTALYVATGRLAALRALWDRPASLVLFGGAAVQLYFLPALFAGEVVAVALVAGLGTRLRRAGVAVPLAAFGFVLGWFAWLRHLETLVDPGRNLAAWVAFGELGLAFWCFPYLTVAFAWRLEPVRRRVEALSPWQASWVAVATALVGGTTLIPGSGRYLPSLSREMIIAFGALTVALAASRAIPPSRWLDSLAACTFGIYLMHPLVVEVLEAGLRRLPRIRGLVIDPAGLLGFALVLFLVTWGLVACTLRVPVLARFLYGVRRRSG